MIIYLACFLAFPMIWGLYMSFTNKTIGNPASFVGLKNYIRLLGDPEYRRSILNTVFLLLFVLMFRYWLTTKIINGITGHSKGASEEATVRTTETHPTPHEQAAIAMAMHLYFDAHDEEPHVITIQEVEKRYSPWSSKITA